ncbi:MAG: dienelactone hydrolase family protein [Burkholderiaceae bacterium]
MGDRVELRAADGHRFMVYRAVPEGTPKGLVVIAPEIFGVNNHIRSVADGYAADGYLTLAPQLFDRREPDFEAGYDQASIEAGRALMSEISLDEALRDVEACLQFGADVGKSAVIGYCWGGTIAWLAAARLAGLSCSVAYYGGGIPANRDEAPRTPIMLHFGEQDQHPSIEDARAVAAMYPQAESNFYPAGHGFNCNERGSYDEASSRLARERTLAFLARHL